MNSKIVENNSMIKARGKKIGHAEEYVVTLNNGEVYSIRTNSSAITDEFMQNYREHHKPLTAPQVKALDENEGLETKRKMLLRFSNIGLFLAANIIGLLFYNAANTKQTNQINPPRNG